MNKIWTFKDSEAVDTDSVDLKTFKATGKFYDDIELACKLFGIRVHPALKPIVYTPLPGDDGKPNEH